MRLRGPGGRLAVAAVLAAAPGCLLIDGATGDGEGATVDPGALDAGAPGILPFGPGSSDPALTWVWSAHAGLELTRSEVTVAQYQACVTGGACTEPGSGGDCNRDAGRPGHPVNCVDALQADAFCAWAGGRLPTGEEWYAEASAGGARTYPWGEEAPGCDRAVMSEEGNGCGRRSSWPVCSRPAGDSVSGACDLSGSVWEWTSTEEGGVREIRGGGWLDVGATLLRARARLGEGPSERRDFLGFRCVRSPR